MIPGKLDGVVGPRRRQVELVARENADERDGGGELHVRVTKSMRRKSQKVAAVPTIRASDKAGTASLL